MFITRRRVVCSVRDRTMTHFDNINRLSFSWTFLVIIVQTSHGRRAPSDSRGPVGVERVEFPTLPNAKLIEQDCTAAANDPAVPLQDPFNGELPDCAKIRYRAHDGSCNNIAFPKWGTTNSILKRLLEPDYADASAAPRKTKKGNNLPSARTVSKKVSGSNDVTSSTTTLMFMQFGQLIDHDITNTPKAHGADGHLPVCCPADDKTKIDPVCLPIVIPKNDVFLAPLKQTCMEFVRSHPGSRTGCGQSIREQFNTNTAFIDGSAIYGQTKAKADSLRTFEGGKLDVFAPTSDPHYVLPPQNAKATDCIEPTASKKCFRAGDSRVNVHLGIAEVQTLWLRQHNFVAATLHVENAKWDDEKLYQEARHIVAAQLQHIMYNEFLPILLGEDMMDKWNLQVMEQGFSDEYDISLNPGILNEFSTAAYRVGHTMVPNIFPRSGKDFNVRKEEKLRTTYFRPFALYDKNAFDEIILGMVSSPTQEIDNNFVEDLTNHLFELPGEAFGLDLTALNVQRGRDHGLQGWMKWRELCGLSTASTFDELRRMNIVSAEITDRMADHYDDIDDVDIYVAGAAENHVPGGKVGPTFACIIAEQFRRLKFGDRFWYENNVPLQSSMTEKQVDAIHAVTMSRILCDNTPLMESVQPQAFLLADSETNPVTPCEKIPAINYRRWRIKSRKGRSLPDNEEVINRNTTVHGFFASQHHRRR